MNDQNLLKTGSIGTVIAAICCFTPALVILLGFAGLSAFIGWLDYGLFPILFVSMGMVAYAFYLKSGRSGPSPIPIIVVTLAGLCALLFWLEFKYALRISLAAAVATAAYVYFVNTRDREQEA
jgi:mercuric ion transport protein